MKLSYSKYTLGSDQGRPETPETTLTLLHAQREGGIYVNQGAAAIMENFGELF